jgi:hypothetical protein
LTGAFTLIGVNPLRPSQAQHLCPKEDQVRSRTIAIAGAIAALSFAAAPVAAIAATAHHSTASAARIDRSRDVRGVRHVDRTPDRHSADSTRDR